MTTPAYDSPQAELGSTETIPRRGVITSWALWDWGSASFNAVVTTFVFSTYLVSDAFGDEKEVVVKISIALAVAGVLIAIVAPVLGQRSDAAGNRKLWLGVHTMVVVAATAGMFFVQPDPSYLILGLVLLASGNIFFEFASVNYNAILTQISTKKTIGRISGYGWGMGYIGGIVLLLILFIGFVSDSPLVQFSGGSSDGVRVSMLISAAWFLFFAIPVLVKAPRFTGRPGVTSQVSFFGSYIKLAHDVRHLWRKSRHTLQFLIASAIFRDGLSGVFTYGAIIAVATFGFSTTEVMIFAIVANLVAGASTIIAGRCEDRVGARAIIIGSLVLMVICGSLIFFLHDTGSTSFWIVGLILGAFVGPVQTSSRTYLSRLIPAGHEGEIFGLYATTGRAASFLAPTAFGVFVAITDHEYWGILGIALVLLIGLTLFMLWRPRPQLQTRHSGKGTKVPPKV